MAVGYVTLTAAADPDAVCTAFEAETNISAATAVGSQGEAETELIDGEIMSAANHIVFKVTGTAVVDITNAITAVGDCEAASGYPSPA